MWATCFGRGQIAGVVHAQWREDVLLDVVVFCFAGELFDQRAEQDVVDVGIAEFLTGGRLQRHGERTTNAFGLSAAASPHGSRRSTSIGSPDVCVSSRRTVTCARTGSFAGLNSGKYFCTGSSNATSPRS